MGWIVLQKFFFLPTKYWGSLSNFKWQVTWNLGSENWALQQSTLCGWCPASQERKKKKNIKSVVARTIPWIIPSLFLPLPQWVWEETRKKLFLWYPPAKLWFNSFVRWRRRSNGKLHSMPWTKRKRRYRLNECGGGQKNIISQRNQEICTCFTTALCYVLLQSCAMLQHSW